MCSRFYECIANDVEWFTKNHHALSEEMKDMYRHATLMKLFQKLEEVCGEDERLDLDDISDKSFHAYFSLEDMISFNSKLEDFVEREGAVEVVDKIQKGML